jgi:hypothetical protein
MKKVLFHSLTIPPDNVSTGMLVGEIAAGFKKLNIEVEVLASTPQYNVLDNESTIITQINKNYSESEYKNVRIVHINSKKKSHKEGKRIFQWAHFHYYSLLYLYKSRNDYEQIFIFSYPPTMNIVSLFVKKVLKLKVTYSVWELYPEIASELKLFNLPILIPIFKKLDTYSMENTDNLIVNSPELKEYLIDKRKLSKKNINVITHFSPYEITNKLPNLELKKMFYAGNLGKPQNLEKFIQTMLDNNIDWMLDIYGAGTEYRKIRGYENDKITLNSHISRQELITNVSDLPVAVVSLDSRITVEGFPGKTFDYLSMNKILLSISNRDSAVAQFINKHNLGINIELDSKKSFLDAFEKLASLEYLKQTLSNIKKVNENQISKSKIINDYFELL